MREEQLRDHASETSSDWKKVLPDDYNSREALESYQSTFLYLKDNYLDYPHTISFETRALCNATCDFCPYPNMERKGDILSDKLINKIIDEMTDIPSNIPFYVTLARINEPFLDPRTLDIAEEINRKLKNASLIFFTNASVLNSKIIDRLFNLKNVLVLSISLNDYRKKEYERLMSLSYDNTLQRIDTLYQKYTMVKPHMGVRITRVSDGTLVDADFISWINKRWPGFDVANYRRSDWLGKVDGYKSKIPNVGCAQWFSLHFLANGKDAFCTMDSNADWGFSNISSLHLLEIYNHPYRKKLRENFLSRLDVDTCKSCPLLS